MKWLICKIKGHKWYHWYFHGVFEHSAMQFYEKSTRYPAEQPITTKIDTKC